MKIASALPALAISLLTATTLWAQPPFGGRGDRGGDSGGRDGGGFRGGPPGGGFGGGPPGGGGDRGGGFRGGPDGGGGPPGGSGGRGSFDPSSMLSRLDTNGNGVLDPDEQQGPAQFIISRLQQADPSIQAGKPIPLKTITASFEKMHGERDGGDSGGGRDSTSNRNAADDAMIPELLVPGFGIDETPVPLLGFGATAEMLSVKVTVDDEREAAERMRRYDRNGDGLLAKDELSRLTGNPLDFDRNRDGKLSASELAVRYARRREGEEAAKTPSKDKSRDRNRQEKVEIPDVYEGRKSYRPTGSRKLPDGLPGFFTDKDANGDGQVTMAEFSTDWSDETVAMFFDSDFNRDGVITADEAIRSVEEGGASQSMASMSSSSSGSAGGSPAVATAPSGGKADDKYVKAVSRILERYDVNKDGALTASEWEKMLMSPAAADGNRDGRVTIEEYALWLESREKKK